MRFFAFVCLLLAIANTVLGAAATYDGFDHTVGDKLGQFANPGEPGFYPGKTAPTGQTWIAGGIRGTTSTDDALISAMNLSIPGLAPSAGNSVRLLGIAASNAVVDRIRIGVLTPENKPQVFTTGELYYSLILRVEALTDPSDGTIVALNGAFIAGFNNRNPEEPSAPDQGPPGVTSAGTRLHVAQSDTDPAKYRIGVRPSVGTGGLVFESTAGTGGRTPGAGSDPVFIVGRYTFVPDGTTNDIHDLWINPNPSDFGAGVAPAPTLTATGGDVGPATDNITGPPAVYCFFLRQNNVAPYSTIVDEVRVGLTWADVTPPAAECNDPRFDADGDLDVDMSDFGAFQICFAQPASTTGCACFDKDASGTVDAPDFIAFKACAAAGDALYRDQVPANPACDD